MNDRVQESLFWNAPAGTVALIFDCDGTLADTMPLHFLAWQTTLDRHGILLTEKRFYDLGGMPSARIIRLLADEHSVIVTDVDEVVHSKELAFLEQLEVVRPLKPVLDVATAYRGVLPMAVASGGYRDVVRKTLDKIGVQSWFDAVVCAEDTARHKPDPDVFIEAANRLGVTELSQCVVFEDTELGLEAARRAGMCGIDVRPWLSAPE